MKIEVVEFYPQKYPLHGKIGSLHVFIVDFGMHLRGIEVYFQDDKLFFYTPSIREFNARDKKLERFPLIELDRNDRKKALLEAIIKAGDSYIRMNHRLPIKKSCPKNTCYASMMSC